MNGYKQVITIVLIAVMAGGCGGGGGGGNGTTEIYQTGSDTIKVYTEEYTINNCSNNESFPQTIGHKMTVSVEAGVGIPINVVEASLRAKYEREESASIELRAAPGTYMVFEIKWTEEAFFGEITYDGQSGPSYEVHVSKPVESSAYDQGCIAGKYRFVQWTEAPSPITLYVEAVGGILVIDRYGNADWTVHVRERGENPSPTPAISCTGRFSSSSQTLEAGPGGRADFWTADMSDPSFSHELWMTFCGWDVGGETDFFRLFPQELGEDDRTLEMKNSHGVMIWQLSGQ